MRPITNEEIDAKIERFVEHCYRLLLCRAMSEKQYNDALRDVMLWAEARRRLNQSSPGADQHG
jgi:hypothetical protein